MSRFGLPSAVRKEETAPQALPVAAAAASPRGKPESAAFDLLDAKLRVHAKLIDELDLSALDKLDDDTMRRRVRGIISEIIRKEEMALSSAEEASFADAVMDEMTGLGPIEPLLKDDSIADILINGCNQVYIERHGKLQLAPVRFADNDHLLRIVQRIVALVGRRVGVSQPRVGGGRRGWERGSAAAAGGALLPAAQHHELAQLLAALPFLGAAADAKEEACSNSSSSSSDSSSSNSGSSGLAAAAVAALRPKLGALSPRLLSDALAGLARAGVRPPPDWLADAVHAAGAALSTFRGRELITLLAALARLRYAPGADFLAAAADAAVLAAAAGR